MSLRVVAAFRRHHTQAIALFVLDQLSEPSWPTFDEIA